MEAESASFESGLLENSYLDLGFLRRKQISQSHRYTLSILGKTTVLHLLVVYFLLDFLTSNNDFQTGYDLVLLQWVVELYVFDGLVLIQVGIGEGRLGLREPGHHSD